MIWKSANETMYSSFPVGQQMMVDYYQVLGVKNTASEKEIKAAYKRLARLRHPDLNGGSAEAAQAFLQVSHARDILLDPKRRAAYDAERNARPGPGSYAPVLKPAGEDPLRRARSDGRIRQNLENFLSVERKEARALRQAVFPIVAFLFAAFCVALIRPRIWPYTGWTGRACGGSTSAATSARARTTRSSRSSTTTATAGPRSR